MKRKWMNTVRTFVMAGSIAGLNAAAGQNMIGRQSQNEGLFVLPAPGEVEIDGRLDDWDLSGRIWIFADTAVRSQYSVELSAMWDADALYLAARWYDPTPMFSTIDPEIEPIGGWKSDSMQLRVRTDNPLWITTWYYTPREQPAMHIAYWKNPNNARAGVDSIVLTADPGGSDLGQGAEMAYRATDDGVGYVQEIRIPWELLYRNETPAIAPGLTFQMGVEVLWGDPTGRTWPVHRYADNMQPGMTSREFFWTAQQAWGDATLLERGNVETRRYVAEEQKISGTIPVRVELPESAARFTVEIRDADGAGIRHLGADLPATDYEIAVRDGMRTVEVLWDGLTDTGELARPGTYQVRGLSHQGLTAQYEMSFYNPGTPPWGTTDGRGAWGADHSAPQFVAAGGEHVAIGYSGAEGGSGLIAVGPDGRKRWGALSQNISGRTSTLAADEHYVYTMLRGVAGNKSFLARFGMDNGLYKRFIKDGAERDFELMLPAIFGDNVPGMPVAMAAHDGTLAMLMEDGVLVALDAESAVPRKTFDLPRDPNLVPRALAFGGDGTLYLLLGEKSVYAMNADWSEMTSLDTPGVDAAVAIAIDHDGNVLLLDMGPDQQVKAFDAGGTLVYTCGRKGGRPIRGDFDDQAISHGSSVAVDARGLVWVTENWDLPRRVSVWNRDGSLARDYIGNTGYSGQGAYLHDDRADLAYVGPVEVMLDRENRVWDVTRILWAPHEDEPLPVPVNSNFLPQRFTSRASGQEREYLFVQSTRADLNALYMEGDDGWRPVAAVALVRNFFEEYEEEDANNVVFWNDLNGDGKVQQSECHIVKTEDARLPALGLQNGWGGRMSAVDLSFWGCNIRTGELFCYTPTGFGDDGAPRYTPQGVRQLPRPEGSAHISVNPQAGGSLVPLPEENLLLVLNRFGDPGVYGIDATTGLTRWWYPNPYPGVHGSHRAPMPRPGLLIGPLKILGVANIPDTGKIFAMRGNLGQDFFMTADGLYVGALFQDGRLPTPGLPEQESQLVGAPMGVYSLGGEPFNGWFGRHSDGQARMVMGRGQVALVLSVNGFDTIRRFSGLDLAVSEGMLADAAADNAVRALGAQEARTYTVTRRKDTPRIDGEPDDWEGIPSMRMERVGSGEAANVRLAYDDTNLYALFEVKDASPWRNSGDDYRRLFKTGDAVDIQLATNPVAERQGNEPAAGDLRILIAPYGKGNAVLVMQPVAPGASDDVRHRYTSPVFTKVFDRVEMLDSVTVRVKRDHDGYTVEAAIPLAAINLQPESGLEITGDVGFISSDSGGIVNMARTYWANDATGLVNDLPGEAWLYPDEWGILRFE